MSVLGLDLGTSGVRAVAFGVDGSVVGSASQPLTLYRDAPGRAELDPTEILHAAEAVVRAVASRAAAQNDPPTAMSFAVLGEAVVPVDELSRPLARVAVSMDTRGELPAARLGDAIGSARFTELTGQPLHGMFSAFKIAAGGEGWQNASGYRCVGDLLTERWTGAAAIDFSQAARTGLFDVETGMWSDDLIAAVAEDAPWVRRSALPRPVPGGAIAGLLRADAALRLGLPEGLPVVAGAHDQAAAFIGAGGAIGGDAVISLGSSDCVTTGTSRRPQGADATGFASYRVDDGLWVTLAGTAAGGWVLEWFAALVGGTVGDIFGDLSAEPPSLLVLPYLAGSGTLDNDPSARGVIHGLTLETTIPQLARAVVEGAGFEFAKILKALRARGIEIATLRVTGSGAQNADGLHARAQAAGAALMPVLKDASARGAAMLAARGAQLDAPGLQSAPGQTGLTRAPDAAHRDWYDAQRRRYVLLYENTRDLAPPPFAATAPALPKEKAQ